MYWSNRRRRLPLYEINFATLVLLIPITIIIITSSVGTRAMYANAYLPLNHYSSTAEMFNDRHGNGFQGISSQGRSSGESIVSSRTSAFIILESYVHVNSNLAYNTTAAGNGVQFSSIQTQPKNVSVGDTFHVSANIFNNSPSILRFISGPCDSALSVTFDQNVLVKHGIGCLLAAHLVELKPGEKVTTSGPSIGTTYRAARVGPTNAAVTFHYQSENIGRTSLTKSFDFDIIS